MAIAVLSFLCYNIVGVVLLFVQVAAKRRRFVVIENKTEYTYTNYRTFHHFFMFRRRLWLWVIVALCEVLGFGLMLLGAFLHGGTAGDAAYFFMLVLMAVLVLVAWFVYPRMGYRSYSKGVAQSYRFGANGVEITTTGQDLSAEQNLQYTGLYRVCETKGFFYLFLSSRQALIVDKGGFSQNEDIAQLRQWLQHWVKKYKIYS